MIEKTSKFNWLRPKWWDNSSAEEHDKRIKKISENRATCSCYMCGNPRRKFKKKTLAEERWEQEDE